MSTPPVEPPDEPTGPVTPAQPPQPADTHIWHTATPRSSSEGSVGNRLLALAFLVVVIGLTVLCVFLAFGRLGSAGQ